MGSIVYGNLAEEQRDDFYLEQHLEGLYDPQLLELFLREDLSTFSAVIGHTVDVDVTSNTTRNRHVKSRQCQNGAGEAGSGFRTSGNG